MVKRDGPIDPRVEKRRQKNKIASANCRDRKLKRAQLLQQQVSAMRNDVEQKKDSVETLKKQIDGYKNFLEKNEKYLTDEEKKRLQVLLKKADDAGPSAIKKEESKSSQSSNDTVVDVEKEVDDVQVDSDPEVKSEPGDVDYKQRDCEVSSTDNDDIPLKKRKYTKRDTVTKS